MSSDPFSLEEFTGTTRLFPLPNLVVFPHVVQPLHIFESRYVEMLEHAVADDHLLAMSLLLPGWETEYDGRPPVAPIVCLGRVMSHSPAKDGNYNVLLAGISRCRITEELAPRRSYREVKLELLEDVQPADYQQVQGELHADLVSAVRKFIPGDAPVQNQFEELLNQENELGTLTDLISYSLPLDIGFRQGLLAELDVLERTRLLLDRLREREAAADGHRPFPPEFSEN